MAGIRGRDGQTGPAGNPGSRGQTGPAGPQGQKGSRGLYPGLFLVCHRGEGHREVKIIER